MPQSASFRLGTNIHLCVFLVWSLLLTLAFGVLLPPLVTANGAVLASGAGTFADCFAARRSIIQSVADSLECGFNPQQYSGENGTALDPYRRVQWPWLVETIAHDHREHFSWGRTDCTASVIGRRWLLTAAHCTPRKQVRHISMFSSFSYVEGDVEVSLGDILYKERNCTWTIPAERIHVHPNYSLMREDLYSWTNRVVDATDNIALLELEEPLSFDHYVQPICLTSGAADADADRNITDAVMFFWADAPNDEHNNVAHTVPRRRVAPIFHPTAVEYCPHFDHSDSFKDENVIDHYCVSSKHPFPIEGTGGGPLMLRERLFLDGGGGDDVDGGGSPLEVWTQVGVASIATGVRSGRNHKYNAFYTRLSPHCKWIEEVTRGEVKCRR